MKRTAKSIQADIAKGAFRPHTALSTMALAYYQQDSTRMIHLFPEMNLSSSATATAILLHSSMQRKLP